MEVGGSLHELGEGTESVHVDLPARVAHLLGRRLLGFFFDHGAERSGLALRLAKLFRLALEEQQVKGLDALSQVLGVKGLEFFVVEQGATVVLEGGGVFDELAVDLLRLGGLGVAGEEALQGARLGARLPAGPIDDVLEFLLQARSGLDLGGGHHRRLGLGAEGQAAGQQPAATGHGMKRGEPQHSQSK